MMNQTIYLLLGLLSTNLSSVVGHNQTSTDSSENSSQQPSEPNNNTYYQEESFNDSQSSTYWLGHSTLEEDTGCTLEIPEAVKKRRQAVGKPLIIFLDMTVLGVRAIPDNGGSFGVDIK